MPFAGDMTIYGNKLQTFLYNLTQRAAQSISLIASFCLLKLTRLTKKCSWSEVWRFQCALFRALRIRRMRRGDSKLSIERYKVAVILMIPIFIAVNMKKKRKKGFSNGGRYGLTETSISRELQGVQRPALAGNLAKDGSSKSESFKEIEGEKKLSTDLIDVAWIHRFKKKL